MPDESSAVRDSEGSCRHTLVPGLYPVRAAHVREICVAVVVLLQVSSSVVVHFAQSL